MRPYPNAPQATSALRLKQGRLPLAALLFSALVAAPACTQAQKQRQAETHAGARTLEVAASLVRDPSIGNAIKEGLSIAQTWFYVLFGIGMTGAAGGGTAIAVRNRRSNKRKTVIEERINRLESAVARAIEGGRLLTEEPGRINRLESAVTALGQLAKDQAARAEGDTSA